MKLKMLRWRWTIIFAAVFGFFLMAGCGNQAAPAQGDNVPAAQPAPPVGQPAAQPAPQAEQGGTITFQYIGGTVPAADEAILGVIRAYTESTGFNVEPIHVTWGTAHQQFVSSLMAGMPPDVVQLGGIWPLEFMDHGVFAPIEDYIPASIIDNFFPSGFDVLTGSNGVRYGLPWDGATWGLFYRKDLFEEAGLDPESPPRDWDELLEFAKALTKPDGSQYGLMFPAGGWEADTFFNPFMWQSGNEVVIPGPDGRFIGNFNTVEGLRAINFYNDLVNTHGVMPVEVTGMMWEAIKNAFTAGQTAMMYNGMWAVNAIRNTAPELEGQWATAHAPAGPGGRIALGHPNSMHIVAQSPHRDMAGKLLEYLYGPRDGQPSVYKEIMVIIGVHSWEKDFIDTMEWARDPKIRPLLEQAEWGRNRPAWARYEQFRRMYYVPGLQALLLGQITPQQFADNMDAAVERIGVIP